MIDDITQGHDMIGIHPTGSGKSLIFQILGAAYPHWINVLFLPTRALIADQMARLVVLGFTVQHLATLANIVDLSPVPVADMVYLISKQRSLR